MVAITVFHQVMPVAVVETCDSNLDMVHRVVPFRLAQQEALWSSADVAAPFVAEIRAMERSHPVYLAASLRSL